MDIKIYAIDTFGDGSVRSVYPTAEEYYSDWREAWDIFCRYTFWCQYWPPDTFWLSCTSRKYFFQRRIPLDPSKHLEDQWGDIAEAVKAVAEPLDLGEEIVVTVHIFPE